jgi:hypothetical protein
MCDFSFTAADVPPAGLKQQVLRFTLSTPDERPATGTLLLTAASLLRAYVCRLVSDPTVLQGLLEALVVSTHTRATVYDTAAVQRAVSGLTCGLPLLSRPAAG